MIDQHLLQAVVKQGKINRDLQIVRDVHLAPKVVIVDGLPGCGKTLFSPIVSALDRVELLTYAYELEYICTLNFLNKVSLDAAKAVTQLLTDVQIYNTMMGRETNVRPSDLSSIFMDANPLRYIKRMFAKGDEIIPQRIKEEDPILHLTTHSLLGFSAPVFEALQDRLVFIEIVRHPLYMIKQQEINMERLIGDVRDYIIYYRHEHKQLPYYALGWEELFLASNPMEKAIYVIDWLTKVTQAYKDRMASQYRAQMITIPFEAFVLNPDPYMKQMTDLIGTKATDVTRAMLKKQNVPRQMIAQGIALDVYKRFGWQPPQSNDERTELNIRRQWAVDRASPKAITVLDRLSQAYEQQYLAGIIKPV